MLTPKMRSLMEKINEEVKVHIEAQINLPKNTLPNDLASLIGSKAVKRLFSQLGGAVKEHLNSKSAIGPIDCLKTPMLAKFWSEAGIFDPGGDPIERYSNYDISGFKVIPGGIDKSTGLPWISLVYGSDLTKRCFLECDPRLDKSLICDWVEWIICKWDEQFMHELNKLFIGGCDATTADCNENAMYGVADMISPNDSSTVKRGDLKSTVAAAISKSKGVADGNRNGAINNYLFCGGEMYDELKGKYPEYDLDAANLPEGVDTELLKNARDAHGIPIVHDPSFGCLDKKNSCGAIKGLSRHLYGVCTDSFQILEHKRDMNNYFFAIHPINSNIYQTGFILNPKNLKYFYSVLSYSFGVTVRNQESNFVIQLS